MKEKPGMLMPALYGGIIMAVISTVPGLSLINCLCCAGVLLGGFMAVFFYKKELMPDMPPMTSSDGIGRVKYSTNDSGHPPRSKTPSSAGDADMLAKTWTESDVCPAYL